MKKLLILAYDFPPYVSVGGLRPYNWYKYLKEYGIEPIVVTRQFDTSFGDERDYIAPSKNKKTIVEETEYGTVLRSPYFPNRANKLLLKYGNSRYLLMRRLISAYFEIAQFLWISGPKKQIYYAANEFLKNNKVDAIIATGDPFVLFFYANKLSKKFDIPWIADYRDPWSDDKKYKTNKLYYNWIKKVEIRNVSGAFSIITVSEFLKFRLKELFTESIVYVLQNGYDPELIDRISSFPQTTKCFTISFVGTMYEWHPWRSFITIFSNVVEQHENSLKLHFYGINNTKDVMDFISQFPEKTQHSISIFSRIPNRELLEQIAKENTMLLFNYYSFMGTKIFDYIGVKRKILLCYENDENALRLKAQFYNIEEEEGYGKQLQADLIRETNSGIVVENEAHLKIALEQMLEEFNQTGKIECNSIGVENYSRKIQVEKLAEIVKDITKEK